MRPTPDELPLADDRCPWWTEDAPIGDALDGDLTVDVCVVGAGYAGLACARRLAVLRPESTIAVVDALAVGQGSAGRNSGFIVDTAHFQPALGAEGNAALVKLARHGLSELRAVKDAHDIECEWDDSGRHHVAVNDRGRAALRRFSEGLDAMGEPYERLSADAVRERLGTGYYSAALHLAGGALVQPAKLVRGLARCLPPSVRLVERTPVTKIDPGPPHTLTTSRGRITASTVVMANNGFVGAWGIARGRVLPLLTFASVTPPQPELVGALPQWGAVPEEVMGSTMRRTADGRLLVRNGVVFARRPGLGAGAIERMKASHRASLVARFEALADVELSHTWGGVLGVSINNGNCFGRIADGAWVCAGFNGVGIALGTALGDLLAHDIAEQAHSLRELAAGLPKPGWLPPSPLLGVGLRAYTGLLQYLAGSER